MRKNTVAIIAFDRISPFHLSVPCAVFGEDQTCEPGPRFMQMVCSAETKRLDTAAGFSIDTPYSLKDVAKASLVIVPSWRDPDEMPPPALLNALRAAHRRGALVVGLCLGAYVLAAAGLLDGRPATTHWYWAADLAARYPKIEVDPNVLYIDDGDVITSAGTAAAIDCCLHILRSRWGVDISNRVARRMVVSPHRQRGQGQFIQRPVPKESARDHFSKLLDWVSEHLDQQHSLDALAERALMTRRTFTRRFRDTMGVTVGRWILHQRLELAQQLLETTDHSIDLIASMAGFGSPGSLRQHFRRIFNTTPLNYRRSFRG